eukprot:3938558-Rhodomonas_salina.1
MIDLAECWWQRDLRDSAATIGRHWERELLLKRKVHPEIKCKKAQICPSHWSESAPSAVLQNESRWRTMGLEGVKEGGCRVERRGAAWRRPGSSRCSRWPTESFARAQLKGTQAGTTASASSNNSTAARGSVVPDLSTSLPDQWPIAAASRLQPSSRAFESLSASVDPGPRPPGRVRDLDWESSLNSTQ